MTLSDLGNLGEFISAVAVVISLLYLAGQIRQNTRTVRASVHHASSLAWNTLNLACGSDAAASSLLLRGSDDYSQLDRDERFRYTLIMRSVMGTHNDVFHQFRERLISEEVWAAHCRVIAATLARPGAREWWERNRQLFSETFQQEISRLLAAV